MPAHLEYFTPQQVALQQEVKNHPVLLEQIVRSGATEWVEQLPVICTYCNVIVDGYYYPEELINLYDGLTLTLQRMRSIIIH